MRILFYIEPLTERDSPTWKIFWVGFVEKMVAALRRDDDNFDFRCVVGDGLESEAKRVLGEDYIACIKHLELIPKFGVNSLEAATSWYRGATSAALREMGSLLLSRLGNFTPEACVTFSPAPFVSTAYSGIPILYFEHGIYSRSPFPLTGYLDPLGMFTNSYVYRNQKIVEEFIPSSEERELVSNVRNIYLRQISESNPLAETIKQRLKDFKISVLVALQFSQFYAYDVHAKYKDQYDTLLHVLEEVPRDIAVIAVEHPQFPLFSQDTIKYLTEKYKNFIWFPQLRSLHSASQYVMEFVDVVVTVSSSVGLQSLLWKKRLVVLGHSHLDVIADTNKLNNLDKLITKPWPIYKENFLAWNLSRYTIPFGLLFERGVFVERLRAAVTALTKQDENFHGYFKDPFANIYSIISFYEKDDLTQRFQKIIQNKDTELAKLQADIAQQNTSHCKDLSQIISSISLENSTVLRSNLIGSWYLQNNPDITNKDDDPYRHWHSYGKNEGRLPSNNTLNLISELLNERETNLREQLEQRNDELRRVKELTLAEQRALVMGLVQAAQKNLTQAETVVEMDKKLRNLEIAFEETRLQLIENESTLLRLINDRDSHAKSTEIENQELATTRYTLSQTETRLNDRFSEIATLSRFLRDAEDEAKHAKGETEWLRQVVAMFYQGGWRNHLIALLPNSIRRSIVAKRLKQQKLFDTAAYLQAYTDVAKAGVDPLAHYINHGMKEGRVLGLGYTTNKISAEL